MILSYKELRKRDVVNIADGKSFGKITDLKLDFPCATLKGIVVCDKKRGGIFSFLCKNDIFIDEKHIIRIGGDVILVNLTADNVLNTAVEMNACVKNGASQDKKPLQPNVPPVYCPPPVNPCQPPVNPCPPKPPLKDNVGLCESEGFDFEDY